MMRVNEDSFLCLALLRRTSFWPPPMVYILVFISHILQIKIFHILDLCGQLSCTAPTPVFLTCGYLSCLLRVPFQAVNLIHDYQSWDSMQPSASTYLDGIRTHRSRVSSVIRPVLYLQATTAGLINDLFSLKNSRSCRDLNPGPRWYQADMLPTELSWLGLNEDINDHKNIFLSHGHQNQGLGKALFAECCKMAEERGIGAVQCMALSFYTQKICFKLDFQEHFRYFI